MAHAFAAGSASPCAPANADGSKAITLGALRERFARGVFDAGAEQVCVRRLIDVAFACASLGPKSAKACQSIS